MWVSLAYSNIGLDERRWGWKADLERKKKGVAEASEVVGERTVVSYDWAWQNSFFF